METRFAVANKSGNEFNEGTLASDLDRVAGFELLHFDAAGFIVEKPVRVLGPSHSFQDNVTAPFSNVDCTKNTPNKRNDDRK